MIYNQTSFKNTQSMPTIIRTKPPKPPAPKIVQIKREQKINNIEINSKCLNKIMSLTKPMTLDLTNSWQNDLKDSPSPPMPTIPPPAPPLEYLTEVNNDSSVSYSTYIIILSK